MVDVSLVVPVYNVEKYIRPSLDSMLSQTHRNIEIILVDDGSKDACGQICDAYAKKDARVRVIHKQNEGTGMARNTGMDQARGDYVYFCDPDDLLDARLVEDNLALARKYDADVVTFGFKKRMDGKETEYLPALSGAYTYPAFWDAFQEADRLMTSLWLRLFKRKYLVDNGLRATRLTTSQDAYFLFDSYAAPFQKAVFHQKSYYTYIIHENSAVSTFKPERFDNRLKVCDRFAEVVHACPYAKGRYQSIVDQRYVTAFTIAFKSLAHASDFHLKKRLLLARGYAKQPAVQSAIARTPLKSCGSLHRQARMQLLKWGLLGPLLWFDGKRPSVKR